MKIFISFTMVLFLSSCSLIQFGGYNPPTKNEALAKTGYAWQKDSTEHFNFYYESKFIPAADVDTAKKKYERDYPELLAFLGVKNYNHKLNLFMLDSRESMKKLIGTETNGVAKPEDNTVYSIFNSSVKTFGKHEFCHVISINEWGMYKEAWLSEGLAVNSDNEWWGYDLHALANYLNAKGKLIPVKKIIENFHNYESTITYPECGSFVRYIKEKYGLEAIKDLWKEGSKGFENKLNKSIPEVEKDWLQEISKYDYSKINYEEKIFKMYKVKL